MNIDCQHYLDLVENEHLLAAWDTESQGFEGDYGRMYVVSVKPFGKEPITLSLSENGQDRGLVKDARDLLHEYPCWMTFYGKGHDVPLLNTRLVRWGYAPLETRHHIDVYFLVKHRLKTGRRSQAHLLEFLGETMDLLDIPRVAKMTVSPNVWSDLFTNFPKNIRLLRNRCASDTVGLEALYRMTRHLIRDIARG